MSRLLPLILVATALAPATALARPYEVELGAGPGASYYADRAASLRFGTPFTDIWHLGGRVIFQGLPTAKGGPDDDEREWALLAEARADTGANLAPIHLFADFGLGLGQVIVAGC